MDHTQLYVALALMGFGLLLGLIMIVLGFRFQFRKQDQRHQERMKALDQGVLPEILQAQAETTRARAAAAIGLVVPLFMAGAAVGGTALILTWPEASWRLPVLCTIWGVCGVVSLVTVATSLGTLPAETAAAEDRRQSTQVEQPANKDTITPKSDVGILHES